MYNTVISLNIRAEDRQEFEKIAAREKLTRRDLFTNLLDAYKNQKKAIKPEKKNEEEKANNANN